MQRQDEFLRDLLAITRERSTAYVTTKDLLVAIGCKIEHRLPLLKPVAMENADLSSGTSIDGEVVCSSRKGIEAIHRARHYADQVETFWRPTYKQMSAKLEAIINALK